MTLFDRAKRKTLKTIAGTGAGVVASSLGIATASESNPALSAQSFPGAASAAQHELELRLTSSSGVVENSLVVKNNSDEAVLVDRFRSDNIAVKNSVVSLSNVTEHGPLILQPGQSKSFQVSSVAVTEEPPTEYVFADHCATQISQDCVDVTLGAFMVGNDALIVAPAS